MFKKNKQKNTEKAFTLVEMLVSLTLFSFVITIALGSLFTIMKANEKAKVMKTVVNNLNIALEGMSREIRVGYDYVCHSDQCHTFKFKTKYGCDAYYEWDSTKKQIIKKIDKKDSSGNCKDSTPVAITSSNVVIDNLVFRTTGLQKDDDLQPRVLINLDGKITSAQLKDPEVFNIQTTVSQRKIDQ